MSKRGCRLLYTCMLFTLNSKAYQCPQMYFMGLHIASCINGLIVSTHVQYVV